MKNENSNVLPKNQINELNFNTTPQIEATHILSSAFLHMHPHGTWNSIFHKLLVIMWVKVVKAKTLFASPTILYKNGDSYCKGNMLIYIWLGQSFKKDWCICSCNLYIYIIYKALE